MKTLTNKQAKKAYKKICKARDLLYSTKNVEISDGETRSEISEKTLEMWNEYFCPSIQKRLLNGEIKWFFTFTDFTNYQDYTDGPDFLDYVYIFESDDSDLYNIKYLDEMKTLIRKLGYGLDSVNYGIREILKISLKFRK